MIVTVHYHSEPDGVWAESPDVEGFSVVGDDLAEARHLVRDGLDFYLDGQDIDLREALVGHDTPIVNWVFGGSSLVFPTGSFGKVTGSVGLTTLAMPAASHAYNQDAGTASVQGSLVDA